MSEPHYFLGLDGGGTKTHCVLYDAENDCLYTESGGPTNHEVLPEGMDGLTNAIGGIVSPLLGKVGIDAGDIDSASFSMGGVDTPIQHEIISRIITEMGFRAFELSNDAYLGIKSELLGSGICAVNGSGYCVVGIGNNGKTFQIGGHGDMSGDRGGACYLVPATICAAYTALFKGGFPTVLVQLLFEWLSIADRLDFCQAVSISLQNDLVLSYKRISQILYQAAGAGDSTALSILAGCGEDYALSIRRVADELGLDAPIDVVLIGSQFTKCECNHTINVIDKSLNPPGALKNFQIRIIDTVPVVGALFWAMEKVDYPVSAALRESLKTRLSSLFERNGK